MPTIPLPSPIELGFPAKFVSWREDQITAIDRTIRSPKRFICATAPTGFGKTLYGVSAGLLNPEIERMAYLTSTKNLQDQTFEDMKPMGMVDVRGQRNYPCEAVLTGGTLEKYRRHRGYVGCDEGPCHAGVWCPRAPDRKAPGVRPSCLAYGAMFDARNADLVNTNYAMWLTAGAHTQGLGDIDMLVCDEAHHAADELESFLTFELDIEDAMYMDTKLVESEELSHWRDWANFHYAKLNSKIETREQQPPQDPEGAAEMRRLKSILLRLKRLREIDPLDWILERERAKAKFSPMRVGRYAEEFLFRGVKKVLLMSATLTKKTLSLLGIAEQDAEIMEFRSTFPLERRPVIGIETSPALRVNMHMTDSDKFMWMRRIDRLIEPRTDRKGLIHPISFTRGRELYEASEHKHLMITHGAGGAAGALREFQDHKGPCILLSPSMETGIDLPDDMCRYQIIGKVPLIDKRGKIMAIRCQLDKELEFYLAMQRLVQMYGRIIRNPLDWGETFIVDDTFGDWFLKRARKHAPKYFLDAVEFTEMFPIPMQF